VDVPVRAWEFESPPGHRRDAEILLVNFNFMEKSIKENWLKVGGVIIILVIIVLIAYFYNKSKNFEVEKQTQKTQLILQEQCSDSAKKFLNEDKWGRAAEDLNSSNVNYTNHYNSKYNKCFILISERFSDGSGTSQVLYDVLDHKEYASGTFSRDGLGKTSNYCYFSVLIPNGYECKNVTDFNRFVSDYMNN
jgi:hypothetical protein